MSSKLEQFNLEQMWLTYLNVAKIKLHELHPDDLKNRKAAFFAGVGQSILVFTGDDFAELNEEDGTDTIEGMQEQIANFFDQQNFEQNG